jgi:hypothetical protein
MAAGTKSFDRLSSKINDRVTDVYIIGDAKEPGRAVEAIAEGSRVGREI